MRALLAVFVALPFLVAPSARAQCPVLGGFGGSAGYGEGFVPKSDDGSSSEIDISGAFPTGLDFFGQVFDVVFINVNGNLTFDGPLDAYTPNTFPNPGGLEMIAPWFADVDTNDTVGDGTPNNIYFHVDPVGRRFIVTWLAVEYYDRASAPGTNTFQLILSERGDTGPGNFDVEFRYQQINWTTGNASGGGGGLGGIPAQIGFDAGDNVNYASHPLSQTAAVVDIDVTPSNHPSECATGSFKYFIRYSCGNGVIDDPIFEECDPAGADPGCSSLCTVNPGYSCTNEAGQPSECEPGCGDGNLDGTEECDDADLQSGDGCSNICRIEPGSSCDTSNPSVPSVCSNACTSDASCAADGFCSGTTCLPDRPNGVACSRDAMCTSGTCVDGVCCDSACDGACAACDLPASLGTCSPEAAGTVAVGCSAPVCDGVALDCPGCGDDTDCAASQFCSDGACVADLGLGDACARDAQCADTCVDGVCCDGGCEGGCEACDLGPLAGLCSPVADGQDGGCGAYLCDGGGGECPVTCGGTQDCASGSFCQDNQCVPKEDDGSACTSGVECGSGHCVDDTCCASPSCAPYRCDTGTCATSCASDDDCLADAFCDAAGQCVPDLPSGGCDRAAQCVSGACADGVCCDTACAGACDRCDLTAGTCMPLPDGSVVAACGGFLCGGAATCPTTCASGLDCAEGFYCNAAAQCVPKLGPGAGCVSGEACASGSCADGVCCDSSCGGGCDRCDASGTCNPLPAGELVATCGGYACDGSAGACPTSCTDDAQCAPDRHCVGGACVPDRAPGATCARGAMCPGDRCVDGVCCTSACGEACDRCDLSGTGTCTPVADGTLATCGAYLCGGVAACPTSCTGNGDCVADHFCNGAGQCVPEQAVGVPCADNTQCASGHCVDSVCCESACDDGCERCDAPGLAGACEPERDGVFGACGVYACDGAQHACPTTCVIDADCTASTYCGPQGHCVADQGPGGACTRTGQCTSGLCVDGVCCDTACGSACDRCDLSGSSGTCAPVADGTLSPSCGGYACDGASVGCPASCASDADCATTYFCDAAGQCVIDLALGAPCDRVTQCQSGLCIDAVCCNAPCGGACDRCDLEAGDCVPVDDGTFGTCGAYACDGGVACPTTCGSDADCVASHYCDAAGACVPDQDDGLACARAGQCLSGSCADGVCCGSACAGSCDRCDLIAGDCVPVPDGTLGTCGDYACDGVSPVCPGECASDDDCSDDTYCDGGACVADEGDGAACDRVAQCASGSCADGACCDAACDGPCDRCDTGECLPVADGVLGTCGAYACDGVDPECPTTCAGDDDCAATHYCGDGVCRPDEAQGASCERVAQCQSGSCADGVCCDTACVGSCDRCSPAGTCAPVVVFDAACGPYACDGVSPACPGTCSDDGDCVADHFCDAAGACVPDRDDGLACARAAQCQSGSCADGVCCDAACGGGCDRCDQAGALGDCRPVPAGTFAEACGAYACEGEATCPGGCVDDDGCATDFFCVDGACVADLALGDGCARVGQCLSGACADGVCCDSGCDGACDRCDQSGDVGQCVPVADGTFVPACGDYACDGAVAECPTTCGGDGDCASETFCDGSACVPDRDDGEDCERLAQCASGLCTLGLCCAQGDCPTMTITAPGDGVVTSDATPTITGTAPPGSQVSVTVDGVSVTVTTESDGTWTMTPEEPLADGAHTIVIALADTELESDFSVDTVAPALAITSPIDGTTRTTSTLGVSGTSEPGAVVVVTIGDQSETVVADAGGAWAVSFGGLADGVVVVDAVATDEAGNATSDAVEVTIDSTGPSVDIVQPTPAFLTNVDDVVVSGTTDAHQGVTLSYGTRVSEVTADATGAFTTTLVDLADGSYTLLASVVDAAEREANDDVTFVVDTTPPPIAILVPVDDATLAQATLSIDGTTEPGATVSVTLDGAIVGNPTIGADGGWTLSDVAVTDGAHTLVARATDAAGNSAETTHAFVVDLTAPGVTIGSPSDGEEVRARPTFEGTSEAETVTLTLDGEALGELATTAGAWSYTPEALLAPGSHTLVATARDAVGNEASASVTFVVVQHGLTGGGECAGGGWSLMAAAGVMLAAAAARRRRRPDGASWHAR